MPNWLLISLGLLATFSFYFFLFLLPDDAYGEEDTRVFSMEKLVARNRTQILVLGDIGRSPRMQNHALSLAKLNIAVDLVGFTDSELHPEIAQNKHKYLKVHSIDKPPAFLQTDSKALFVLFGPLKVIFQFCALWMILGHRLRPARTLLVQNPPSIPTLLIASIMCWFRKTRLIIDWHNTGYSILALKLGPSHPMVRISKRYEKFFSQSADVNFTVSEAMKRQLKRDFGITAPLLRLYDRPTTDFRIAQAEERLAFLRDMELPAEQRDALEKNKLKVLVSSTSWTPDEDFSILLDALVGYSRLATTTHPQLPELLVIITGKGPLKQHYLNRIDSLERDGKLEMVMIKVTWLPTYAYAMLLASADIGISLHKSSSGVDLPMKVVDMFGAGLPVVGYSLYESWPELVQDGVNGRNFENDEELKSILVQLLGGDGTQLAHLREGAARERQNDWNTEWSSRAGELFQLPEQAR
ncbi:mannosyltransferase [Thelotrema lepadinum]|nr:mannosyltransferase [Thelotrema lepadinum]